MRDSIVVYGVTKEDAYDKLQDLLNNMKYGDVANVKKGSFEFVVVLKNRDTYRAIGASDNARGVKWQYAYIDSTIDETLVDSVILPNFTPRLINGEYDTNAKIVDRAIWF